MADFTENSNPSELRQSGYFRIGHIVLDIPPTDISTNKVINDDQVATLRTGTPMFVKSGQSRWDVTLHWKAVREVKIDGTYDYSQWAKLRKIVAIFKAAPFVEVENDFLRQHFTNIHQAYSTARMAFALRQLQVNTDPSTTNVINVTLTMSLFNYAPYSKDFGYADAKGISSDAPNSSQFAVFMDNWERDNMNTRKAQSTNPPVADWTSQDDGVLKIQWRKYAYAPFKGGEQPPAVSGSSAGYGPTSPSPRIPKRLTGKLSDAIRSLISRKAKQYNLDPAVVEAQCLYESHGDPNAISRTGAVGLLQLIPSTAQLTRAQLLDPETNIDSGCKYLAEQLKKFGNYPHALGAYNAGPGYIYAYRDGKTIPLRNKRDSINPEKLKTADGLPPANIPKGENVPKYVQTILHNAGRQDVPPEIPKAANNIPPTTPTTTTPIDAQDTKFAQSLKDAIASLPQNGQQWYLDHYTELGAYFFQEEQIIMASAEAEIETDFDCFPNQFSVVFVNNLPLIPLASMQYPTFQHVGPTDTIITIAMDSVGDYPNDSPLSEAEHAGIQALTNMTTTLESQFHQLRTNFRAVSSIHRMQAVFMENKFLNLLGIEGTIIRGLNTETVPETANLSQVALHVSQYENIFEEVGAFKVNGLFSANAGALKALLLSGELSNISKEQQNALTEVKKFADAWRAKDTQFIVDQVLSISQEPSNDFLNSTSGGATSGLRSDQKAALLANMDLAVNAENSHVGFFAKAKSLVGGAINGTFKTQAQVFPGLNARTAALKAGADMSYADYLIYTSMPIVNDVASINSMRTQVEAKVAADKATIVDTIYQSLFDWSLLTNPAFSRQATMITNSPEFKDRFNKNISVVGPAAQRDKDTGTEINAGHGCYRDYGLQDYNSTPASYFIDYNKQITDSTDAEIKKILGTANETANQTNRTGKVNGNVGATSSSNSSEGFTFTDGNQGLPGDANALVRMKSIPAYSMNTAFPTFKLLLIEEDNNGPFFAFDNFYSFASVIDIEVIKYREQPDTAIIQISNLANLLQHRMYDDTAAGKMERHADRLNTAPGGGLVIGGPGASPNEVGTGGAGGGTAGITASKTAAGIPYQYWRAKDLVEGRTNHGRIPLKFFALQTGSKIQVRMGFSNNPDLLFPVFTGQVTQIDGTDTLTITCQSFQLELMTTPGTTVQSNSRWGFNVFNGGAAFGGWAMTNSGDTLSIMQTMLRSEAARHFGHWQINNIANKKIKGFEWSELIGQAAEQSSNKLVSQIGSILQTGYDRSGENILINSSINIDASQTKDASTKNGARAGFDKENPNILVGTAKYGIDKQSKRSIWDLIRDIGRRYPQFNLMVRDYGFPFAADATLVFAHPLDWYYSRPTMYGDAEREKISNVTHNAQFKDWWSHMGKAKWDLIWAGAYDNGSIFAVPIRQALKDAQQPMTDLAGEGPEQFSGAVDYLASVLTGSNASNLSGAQPFLASLYKIIANAANSGNLTQKFYLNLNANFQALYREWLVYLQLTDPAANSSRIKPVRKYHLIDYNHIVHNGMSVNDNIYNAVKISDLSPMKFNQNIPNHHTRILDVTDQIEDVPNNIKQGWSDPLAKVYAQSFLREEVGQMYQGEIVLRGVPEIEPYDVLLLNDTSTGIIGPVEVDTVIHSFNLENGYITIVKPRLLVITNESVSCNVVQTLGLAWATGGANLQDLGSIFDPFNINTTTSARLVETIGAPVLLAGAVALAWFPPVGLALAALGLLAGAGIIVAADIANSQNPFKILPVSRFGRPWIGGLQGFEISNFAYSLGQKFKWFDAEEFAPTIESWNELIHYRDDYIPQ